MTEQELLAVLEPAVADLAGVKIYWKSEWAAYRFDILDKMFAMVSTTYFTFKNSPEQNDILRSAYPFVIPGYYMNKTHWNSIVISENQFSEQELTALLLESYQKVFEKLTKKQKNQLLEDKQ
ncbi:MAG: MmcQ/YjbR family DNA-binding protein [Streptococcaceae bacterium]|jgi:predicted DNA-binding protein (MmcQ/YjbR family)|nr:MmcQ/YjbR family DNA-binding protein [Streptococcaceae bacterium]MCH4177953.1 MmcQ/YjbR family DNA-binding protein [Streptococcaceae bacterium]